MVAVRLLPHGSNQRLHRRQILWGSGSGKPSTGMAVLQDRVFRASDYARPGEISTERAVYALSFREET